MRPTSWFFTAVSFAVVSLLGIRIAQAAPSNEPPLVFEVDLRTGWVHGQQAGGVAVGVTPKLRYRVLTLGADVQGATIMFTSLGSLGAVAGLSLPWRRVRIDALGAFGVNAYANVGSNFFTEDPGANAAVPYAGGRGAFMVCVSCNPVGTSFWLGLTAEYAEDLYLATRTYTYVESGDGWFGEGNDQEFTETIRVGQSRASAFVTAAFAFPL